MGVFPAETLKRTKAYPRRCRLVEFGNFFPVGEEVWEETSLPSCDRRIGLDLPQVEPQERLPCEASVGTPSSGPEPLHPRASWISSLYHSKDSGMDPNRHWRRSHPCHRSSMLRVGLRSGDPAALMRDPPPPQMGWKEGLVDLPSLPLWRGEECVSPIGAHQIYR